MIDVSGWFRIPGSSDGRHGNKRRGLIERTIQHGGVGTRLSVRRLKRLRMNRKRFRAFRGTRLAFFIIILITKHIYYKS